MATEDQNQLDDLRNRIGKAEATLRRIKLVLTVAAALVVCLLIPPLRAVVGLGIIIAAVLVALFGYMYAVIWACERIFAGPPSNRSNE